jgi:endo-1,4-beta-xylanase
MQKPRTIKLAILATLFLSVLNLPAQATPSDNRLRDLAGSFLIGYESADNFWTFPDAAIYQDTAKSEFNILTPGNQMKWVNIHPQESSYDFFPADQHVQFAQQNNIEVHGHTLVWHNQNPAWLTGGTWTKNTLTAVLYDHIDNVVGHYKHKVLAWDVVNEAFNGDGTYRSTLWYDTIGKEYIELAFQRARGADPSAKLIYNDFNIETVNSKSTAVYNMAVDFKNRGIPIDGVGLQTHLTGSGLNYQSFANNMQRFAALGLEIYITEMDVRLPMPASQADLDKQTIIYSNVINQCLAQPACKGLQTWGFTDKYSWIPSHFPGFGDALILNKNYKPKPAYAALQQALADANPNATVGIFAPYLPNGEVGVPYSRDLQVGGGDPPYVTSIAKGAPPLGLGPGSENIAGIPIVAGTERFAVQVADNLNVTATRDYKIKILKQVGITTTSLKAGMAGKQYSNILRATRGKKSYIWSIVSGALPSGLSLNAATGKISGPPTSAGSSVITVQVTDALGGVDQQQLTLTIN